MTKRVTTSAQKTVRTGKSEALQRLRAEVGAREGVEFTATSNADIEVAELEDGSKLYVASFDRGDGRTVAMIDHKNVDERERQRRHQHWRDVIDAVFAGE